VIVTMSRCMVESAPARRAHDPVEPCARCGRFRRVPMRMVCARCSDYKAELTPKGEVTGWVRR